MAHYKKEKENEEKIAENIFHNQNNNFNSNLFLKNSSNQVSTTLPTKTKVIDNNARASPVKSLYKNLIKKNSAIIQTQKSNSNQNDLANNKTPLTNNSYNYININNLNSNTNNNNIINCNNINNGKDINNQNNFKEAAAINNNKNSNNTNNTQKKQPESEIKTKKQSKKNIFGLKLLKTDANNNNNYNNSNAATTGERTIYASVDAKYDEIFNKLNFEYEPKKYDYEKQIEKIDKNLPQLDSDIKLLKSNLDILFAKQREYYTDLLSKGIDVRSEGLIWIVKRLIELNAVVDHTIFPRFLDKAQIEFIIFVSFKSVEISQIKILMKMLRAKQLKENKRKKIQHNAKILKLAKQVTDLRSEDYLNNNDECNQNNNDYNNKNDKGLDSKEDIDFHKVKFNLGLRSEEVVNEEKTKIMIDGDAKLKLDKHFSHLKQNENLTTEISEKFIQYNRKNSCEMYFNTSFTGKNSYFYLKTFSEKALNIFDHIFKKYEIIGKNMINHFMEDKITLDKINVLKEKLRHISSGNAGDEETLEDIGEKTNKFLEYFMNNCGGEQAYLNEIVSLKDTLKKFESEINAQKQMQINSFGKRYESLKSTGEFSIQNELIYSCLFGNGIA